LDRSRAGIRSDAADSTEREPLGALIVLVQLLVLSFCAVRTALDLLRGGVSVEGGLALALGVILALSLVRRAITRATAIRVRTFLAFWRRSAPIGREP
jgi:hypothetical protein